MNGTIGTFFLERYLLLDKHAILNAKKQNLNRFFSTQEVAQSSSISNYAFKIVITN